MSPRRTAEELISELMESRAFSRSEAVVAIVTLDGRQRHFGRKPLVEGAPLSVIYAEEMRGELTDDQAVRVVAYLQGISEDDARAHLMDQVAEGLIHFETKH